MLVQLHRHIIVNYYLVLIKNIDIMKLIIPGITRLIYKIIYVHYILEYIEIIYRNLIYRNLNIGSSLIYKDTAVTDLFSQIYSMSILTILPSYPRVDPH